MRKVEKAAFMAAAAESVPGFEPCEGDDEEDTNEDGDYSFQLSNKRLSAGSQNSSGAQNEGSSRRGGGGL
jgi:hypothetical protein